MIERIQVGLLFILIPVGLVFWYTTSENITLEELFFPGTKVVHIDDVSMRVEVADTDEERIKGLSGKEDIGRVNGLLFMFPREGYHGIWMKDMKFPIDIIWIDTNLNVVAVDKSVLPETFPKTFRPPVPVQYLIETEARYTEIFGIKAGDKVVLPKKLED